jgi:hypothetical protein
LALLVRSCATHDLATVAAQEVGLAATPGGHHVRVGLHGLQAGLAVQVGGHDLGLALRVARIQQNDPDILPGSRHGLLVALTVSSHQPSLRRVHLVVALVAGHAIVDLLHSRFSKDE